MKKKRLFPRRKARPDQAGSVRRGLAFLVDLAVIASLGGIVTFLLGGGLEDIVSVDKSKTGSVVINFAETFNVIREGIVGYLYFILFFRFGGRTLGKRLFGLRVVDLGGAPRLGWYQAFERAHGYAASALASFLGFLQVLWNKEGLTMHDQLARTTVVRGRLQDSGRVDITPPIG